MKNEALLRFIKLTVSGLAGGTVDLVLVWLFSEYVFSSYCGDIIISPIISYECSVFVGFAFDRYLVWNDRVNQGDNRSFMKSLIAYNVSNIGVFGIRMLLVLVIERIFRCNLVVTNLIGRLLAGLLNYVISDKFIFKKDSHTVL